jgi:hypothetical protein
VGLSDLDIYRAADMLIRWPGPDALVERPGSLI